MEGTRGSLPSIGRVLRYHVVLKYTVTALSAQSILRSSEKISLSKGAFLVAERSDTGVHDDEGPGTGVEEPGSAKTEPPIYATGPEVEWNRKFFARLFGHFHDLGPDDVTFKGRLIDLMLEWTRGAKDLCRCEPPDIFMNFFYLAKVDLIVIDKVRKYWPTAYDLVDIRGLHARAQMEGRVVVFTTDVNSMMEKASEGFEADQAKSTPQYPNLKAAFD